MPICTLCGSPIPSLFTVYSSASNIRLTICENCNDFADPYVEQPPLLLFLDLVLLRPGVYRHLLFNRGTEPIQAGRAAGEKPEGAESPVQRYLLRDVADGRWKTVMNLLLALSVSTIVADTYLRWIPLHSQSTLLSPSEDVQAFIKLLIAVVLETLAFHLKVLVSALILLKTRSFLRHQFWSRPRSRPVEPDASKGTTKSLPDDFHPLLIPLTLLLSSLPKLLLLLLLSIWPTPTDSPTSPPTSPSLHTFLLDLLSTKHLEWLAPILAPIAQETLDREWVVRNVLGGMGIGFGLRVLLMGRLSALETTSLVCVGWWGRWKLMEWLGDERGELKL